jgi:cytochrome P450
MPLYPPGPKSQFLLGSLRPFQQDRLAFLASLPPHGDLTYMRLGRAPVYAIHHPDLIRQVLVEQAGKFQKLRLTRRLFNRALRGTADSQLAKTEAWKKRRELVQAAFHAVQVESYAQTITDETQAMLTTPVWNANSSINIYTQLRSLTLHIVMRILFGTRLASNQAEAVMEATSTLQLRASKRFNTLFTTPMWIPTPDNRRIGRAVKTLDRLVEALIAECDTAAAPRSDLLATLVASSDTLQLDAIREELISLLMSGHETTATALTWTCYLLAQNPSVEAKLREELREVLCDRSATAADVSRLPYTEAVIKEALRLYPPSWVISRRVVESVTLNNYPIPVGSLVYIVPYSLHRDARWFQDVDQFIPERFLPENSDQIPRYSFLPFGTGPRKCIGSAFAMLEAVLVLTTLLQQVELTLIPGQRIVPEALITLRPQFGIRMKVTRP